MLHYWKARNGAAITDSRRPQKDISQVQRSNNQPFRQDLGGFQSPAKLLKQRIGCQNNGRTRAIILATYPLLEKFRWRLKASQILAKGLVVAPLDLGYVLLRPPGICDSCSIPRLPIVQHQDGQQQILKHKRTTQKISPRRLL